MGGGAEDGALVVLEHFEPGGDVARVIVARLGRARRRSLALTIGVLTCRPVILEKHMLKRFARTTLGTACALVVLYIVAAGLSEIRHAIAPATLGSDDAEYMVDLEIEAYVATFSWTTAEPSNGELRYGTSSAALTNRRETLLSRTHAITLTGLTPGTIYYYRIRILTPGDQGVSETPVYAFTTLGPRPVASAR
jgi:hypothetical protein